MNLGRSLILIGLLLAALGALILLLGKLHFPIGQLPGDIVWRGKNTRIYFPIVTCLLISLLLSLIFWLINRR